MAARSKTKQDRERLEKVREEKARQAIQKLEKAKRKTEATATPKLLSPPPPPPFGAPPPAPPGPPGPPGPPNITNNRSPRFKKLHWNPLPSAAIVDTVWAQERLVFDLSALNERFSVLAAPDGKGATALPVEKEPAAASRGGRRSSMGNKNDVCVQLFGMKRCYQLEIGIGTSFFPNAPAPATPQEEYQRLKGLCITMDERRVSLELLTRVITLVPSPQEAALMAQHLKDTPPDDGKETHSKMHGFFAAFHDMPYIRLRLRLWCCAREFNDRYTQLMHSFTLVKQACEQLLSSHELVILLQAILQVGNYMHTEDGRREVAGFRVGCLQSLLRVKGSDGTNLFQYVVSLITSQHDTTKTLMSGLPALSTACALERAALLKQVTELSNEIREMAQVTGPPCTLTYAHSSDDVMEEMGGPCGVEAYFTTFLTKANTKFASIQEVMGATDAKVAEVRRFFSLDDGADQLQWEQALGVFDKVCKAFDHEMLRQQRTHEKQVRSPPPQKGPGGRKVQLRSKPPKKPLAEIYLGKKQRGVKMPQLNS